MLVTVADVDLLELADGMTLGVREGEMDALGLLVGAREALTLARPVAADDKVAVAGIDVLELGDGRALDETEGAVEPVELPVDTIEALTLAVIVAAFVAAIDVLTLAVGKLDVDGERLGAGGGGDGLEMELGRTE